MYLWDIKGDKEVYEGRVSHCHKECEIYYMIDGEAAFLIEGHKYLIVSDSLMLIPPNCFHQWEYPVGKVHHRVCIHFLPEMLNRTERDFFLDLFVEPLHFLDGLLYNLNFYVQSIIDCKQMEASLRKIAVKCRMLALLSQIHFLRSTKTVKPVVLDERICAVINYIGEHLREDLSLDILSRRFGITKNHLNVLFHKTVGTPLMKYVTVKRLGHARQEIISGARLGEAAYNIGFNDYSAFYRAYKTFYGCPPSELLINSSQLIDYPKVSQ